MDTIANIAGTVGIASVVIGWTFLTIDARQPHRTSLRTGGIALLIAALVAALVVVATAP